MKTAITVLALALTLPLAAAEGKWTPQQVLELDPKWLAGMGLELPPQRLWDPSRGTGLLAATISTGGCSGGWISATGLFITNHHCLFGVLQEHATPENDIITNGFLARRPEDEIRSSTVRVTIPRRFTDVTARVNAAVPRNATDLERFHAVQKAENEIVAECEKQPRARCRVAAHDGGLQYVLQEMAEIDDVRLVLAPPRAIGEFGGETDNWMWPRHTGDFAIGRAYVDGKPYQPEFFFPIASEGIAPDDFVMVLGYPGVTYRALTAAEMEERVLYFQARAEVYRQWIRLLEESTRGNDAGVIAVADLSKTLANRQKNGEGQLAGLRRGRILEKQRAGDEAVLSWARARKEHAAAVAAAEELAQLAAKRKDAFARDFLLEHVRVTPALSVPTGPKALVLATTVARAAMERTKADGARDGAFNDRNFERLKTRLEREQKSFFAPADRALFADFVRRALELPEPQRLSSIESAFRGQNMEAVLDRLYGSTKVLDTAERTKMLGMAPAALHAIRDPLLELGFAVAADLEEMIGRRDAWDGAVLRLRPVWRRAVIAHAGQPVAPDANSTLRVSFAHVKGYQPRDGVWHVPQTTLSGVIEKHTNEEPFDVPDPILAAAVEPRTGPSVDARLRDVPVNFLADGDTTGGNSGSPVVNGRGELVGVNFDRVWENVANDFGYNPDIARNISVDVRYMLWLLEEVLHAKELLEELGLKR
jgi:hypothetical protein